MARKLGFGVDRATFVSDVCDLRKDGHGYAKVAEILSIRYGAKVSKSTVQGVVNQNSRPVGPTTMSVPHKDYVPPVDEMRRSVIEEREYDLGVQLIQGAQEILADIAVLRKQGANAAEKASWAEVDAAETERIAGKKGNKAVAIRGGRVQRDLLAALKVASDLAMRGSELMRRAANMPLTIAARGDVDIETEDTQDVIVPPTAYDQGEVVEGSVRRLTA